MKYFFLFILALILSGAMTLSHVPRKVTAHESASRYSISGSPSGTVTVTDIASGKIIRTFQMDSGVVVRETFLLDGGKTVAASQKDHAVFWDLETGREIRRFPQRIYGFSPDETKFFTYESPGQVFLYAYPNGVRICKLVQVGDGPAMFQFSPNSQFLVIAFYTGMPSDDENYPYPNSGVWRANTRIKLFNLRDCHEVEEFSQLRIFSLGEFTRDSKSYYMKDIDIDTNPDVKKR